MPPSQPFIHGCLRVKGRRGKHAIASNKTDHRFGVNAWSVQVNQTMCSIRTDHAISGHIKCLFVQAVLLLLSWSILCVGMKEVYLSFNYNDIR